MRARPSEYELVAPGELSTVLDMLAKEPGVWMPIAGGTELMVQYGAGRLPARKLVSLWGLPELRSIETSEQEVLIGAEDQCGGGAGAVGTAALRHADQAPLPARFRNVMP